MLPGCGRAGVVAAVEASGVAGEGSGVATGVAGAPLSAGWVGGAGGASYAAGGVDCGDEQALAPTVATKARMPARLSREAGSGVTAAADASGEARPQKGHAASERRT
jgi:hypothetical protein